MNHQNGIRQRLHTLQQSVDALSPRERVLVFATITLLMVLAWYLVLMQPLTQQAIDKQNNIETLRQNVETSNHSFEEQVLQLSGSGSDHQRRLLQMQDRIDKINEQLGEYAAELIDPKEMARVLEGVLEEQSHLRLVRIRNLAPEALPAEAETQATTFYRHGLEIEFEGNFFDCLEYLQQIEALPWRFYWQLLDLEVLEYPTNRVRVEVSTLSLDKEWVGA